MRLKKVHGQWVFGNAPTEEAPPVVEDEDQVAEMDVDQSAPSSSDPMQQMLTQLWVYILTYQISNSIWTPVLIV